MQVEGKCCTSLGAAGTVAAGRMVNGCGRMGRAAGCYRFIHALYQEVVYQRLPAAQRVHLHRRRLAARAERGVWRLKHATLPQSWPCTLNAGGTSHRAVAYLPASG